MSRKASSASPTRPMSDGITMGASSTFDRLMTSMHKQKGGASSSTRQQPQLTSSSLGLTPPLWPTGDISDMFAGVMNGLEELRRDMTKRIDQVDERAHYGRENLRDELTHVKSQARFDQAQLTRNIDQCLAESLTQANKESEEREARMTREIERLLNDHDITYAHTMTGLEKRLDAKSDLMMRRLDAILNGSNWGERSNPRERSRHANDGDGMGNNARAQQSSRTNNEQRMASLQAEGLSSSYDQPEIIHPDRNFTVPEERHEQEGVFCLADQAYVRWDNDGSVINVRQIDDVDAQAKRRCVIKYQATAAVDLVFSGANPAIVANW